MQKLNRTTFETSRELEFFSEKELQMQIGHGVGLWPAALLKELVDNALDACEASDILPQVEVDIGEESFSVRDNGSGLPAETLAGSLDYLKRVSDKAYYVSPTRGQLGNALKVVWAAPFVAHGEHSKVEVWSQGLHHRVEVSVDRIAQKPVVDHTIEESDFVKNGTFVKIHWPDLACSTFKDGQYSYQITPFPEVAQEMIEGYASFNPHATFKLDDRTFEATDPIWKKWRPDEPTSPHWYTPETFKELIAAYVAKERSGGPIRTVRDLVSEFRGLAGTAKQKQATADFKGAYLHDFVKNGDIDIALVERLLEAMKELSKVPKPAALGVIGEDNLKAWMVRYAGVAEQSVKYTKRLSVDGLPHVLEVAFGVRDEGERKIISGLNWAPTLVLPAPEVGSLLGAMRIDAHDPVTVVMHIARPRFEFVDRGKTRIQL